MRSFPCMEVNLKWQYVAQCEVHLRSKTYTIPQTEYIDYDDRSEHKYYGQSNVTYHMNDFQLQFHKWQRWQSTNHVPRSVDTQQAKRIRRAGRNDDCGLKCQVSIYTALKYMIWQNIVREVHDRTKVVRFHFQKLLSTEEKPASLWHRGFSSDLEQYIRQNKSSHSTWMEE